MKEIGEAQIIRNVKIQHNCMKRMLYLSKKSYISNILEQFNIQTCNLIDTPLVKGENLKLYALTPEEK